MKPSVACLTLAALSAAMTPAAIIGTTAAHATTIPTRYAKAGVTKVGTPTTKCPKSVPCSITTAINLAPPGSLIVIESGTYGSAKSPLTTELSDPSAVSLTIVGQSPKHPPRIYSAATTVALALPAQSSLSGVSLIASGDSTALEVPPGSAADHVAVQDASPTRAACQIDGTLTDSLCVAGGTATAAVDVVAMQDESPLLQGVTAVATGKNGVGANVEQNSTGSLTMAIDNSIVKGNSTDVVLSASTGEASIDITSSDVATTKKVKEPGTETIRRAKTDVSAAPRFVDAATGDYAEKASSPTVNKGAADDPHDTDLAGNPRTLGSAPDLGAYEFRQKPGQAKVTVTKVTKTTIEVTARINSGGATTTLRATATHAAITRRSSSSAGHSGHLPWTAHLTIRHLKPHTRYAVAVTATNEVGSRTVNGATTRTK
jgi:hypothetical protein